NSDIIGMAVAGCVSFVLFSVVIAYIIITFHWKNWFNGWMRLRGKVRMPRAYIHKKEEAKRRLITTTPVSKSIDATIELEDEDEEVFTIETEVMDDE
ncbi:unnamed protein product, partial [Candidula unifasciata]